jgi:hypothetical protein
MNKTVPMPYPEFLLICNCFVTLLLTVVICCSIYYTGRSIQTVMRVIHDLDKYFRM